MDGMGLSGMEDGEMGNDGRTDGGLAQAAADAARRATGRGLAEDAGLAPVCLGGADAAGIGDSGLGTGEEGRPESYAMGVQEPLVLRGFPKGRVRIRQRPMDFVSVTVRTPDGGIRGFWVKERDGAWVPGPEFGSNRRAVS